MAFSSEVAGLRQGPLGVKKIYIVADGFAPI